MSGDHAFAVHAFGKEKLPVIVLDAALNDPAAIIDRAARTPFTLPPGGAYPGLNGALPRAYIEAVVGQMRPILEDVFHLPREAPIDLMGYFGLATKAASELHPIQTVPHIDSVDPHQLAFVHYLFDGDFGGTGFFRHDSTGFQSVTANNEARFRRTVSEELSRQAMSRHVHDKTIGYTLVGAVASRFNRLIIYRSNTLHSGLLTDGLPVDGISGRLTANCFVRPRSAM